MLELFVAGTAPGSRPALVTSDGATLDYAGLRERVQGLACAWSALGAAPGRLVALVAPTPLQALLGSLAVLTTGAALAPLDARAGARYEARTLARLRPLGVVRGLGFEPCAEPRELAPDTGLVLLTSGSGGEPKAVALARAGVLANIAAILEYLPLRADSRTAVVLPLHYSYALVGQALATLAAGGTVLLLGDLPFATSQLAAMTRLEANGLSSVPTSLRLLCEAALAVEPAERPALGYLASAGAALDVVTRGAMRAAFPTARLFNQYGLTEASPRVAAVSDLEPAFAAGAVGRAIAGIKLEVVGPEGQVLPPGSVGVLRVSGPSVMMGYLDDAEGTARVLGPLGLLTGDRGYADAQGLVWVEGRADDVVKVAGERVALAEVNAVLADAVTEACVVAIPDERFGHRLVAFVVGDMAAARVAAREHLPPAKRPQRFEQLAALPRLASDKLDLVKLRTWAIEGIPQ